MIEKLQSDSFKEYLNELVSIREKLDNEEKINMDIEDFQCICGVYHLYTWTHSDITILQKNIMDLLVKHKDRIDKSTIQGIGTYTLGYLESKYDPSGYFFLSCSLEIAASIDAKNIAKSLKPDFPKDAQVFIEYELLLKSIEGAYHTIYWILREIANKYLDTLYPITLIIEPIFKSFVLHSLDAFENDKKVIKFYKDYIEFFEKVKNDSDNEQVHKECIVLIGEAKEYLSHIE